MGQGTSSCAGVLSSVEKMDNPLAEGSLDISEAKLAPKFCQDRLRLCAAGVSHDLRVSRLQTLRVALLLLRQRLFAMDKVLLTAPPALAAGTAALNRLAARPTSGSAATPLAAALIGNAPVLEAAAGDVSAARDTVNFLLRAVSRNASTTTKQLRSLLEAHSDLSGAAIEVVQAAVAMVG